ncbi:hypothetical protein [Lacinutrix mariniflava]|uniref:hypothetical protein n=1 Tax=Lacinutrix mariniflava TaxID=342955 RepID=UPI0006E22AFC|nr:hypothetical protein [Lacinutrix mariniflava]
MKKVIFGAAALLFSGALMAQTNDVNAGTMTGINGTSAVDADYVSPLAASSFGGNSGESIQNGNGNKVMVRQAGIFNSTYTDQADGLGSGGNQARIWQTGEVLPPPSAFNNEADVRQRGTNNKSTSIQEGDFNEAITRQGMKEGTLGLSKDNVALIHHGTGQQGEANFAMTEQDGEGNSSKTVQQFDNSDARTIQEGDFNIGDIKQNAGPDSSAGHEALLEQYGDSNVSRMRQNGDNRNTARSVQVGDSNLSNQNQTSVGGSGVGNNALVDQGTNFPFAAYGNSQSALAGVDNITNAGFNGDSENAEALQNQVGNANDAYIGQFGDGSSVGNHAAQNQNGQSNEAGIIQNAFGNANGGDNYARQDQGEMGVSTGDSNIAHIGQNGTDHKAYQRQYGDSNSALSTQRGTMNYTSTYQGGNGNALETGQRGTMNEILVVQKEQGWGGHSYKVSQNLPGGTPVGNPNGGNVADILQLGPNGDFATDGEGMDFQSNQNVVSPNALNATWDIANPCGAPGSGC